MTKLTQTMSVYQQRPDSGAIDSTEPTVAFSLPENAPALCWWLDDQPNFIEFEHQRRFGTHTGLMYLPERYEADTRACYQSQGDVMQAWKKDKFPAHRLQRKRGQMAAQLYTRSTYKVGVDGPSQFDRWEGGQAPTTEYVCTVCEQAFSDKRSYRGTGVIDHIDEAHPEKDSTFAYRERSGTWVTESEINFAAYQFLDGSGLVEHYSTIAAIRTRDGVVIDNTQNFARGRARLTRANSYREKARRLPLTAIERMLDDEPEDIFDIVSVERNELDEDDFETSFIPHREERRQVKLALLSSGRALAVFYDETANNWNERKNGLILSKEEVDALRHPNDVYELLKPDDVAAAESDGLDIVGSQAFGSPYRSPREGNVIVRQGEWFFIPMDEDFEPDTPVYARWPCAPGWMVESLPFEAGISGHSGLRQTCANCGESRFNIYDSYYTCKECEHVHLDKVRKRIGDGAIEEYVDPSMVFPTDAMGNHRPQYIAADTDGHLYVKGLVGHNDNDHNQIGFDRWHRISSNERDDVVVFNSSPDTASGRSGNRGGTMRYD